jgi:hypothetical protein
MQRCALSAAGGVSLMDAVCDHQVLDDVEQQAEPRALLSPDVQVLFIRSWFATCDLEATFRAPLVA